jgi:hypothetical protein
MKKIIKIIVLTCPIVNAQTNNSYMASMPTVISKTPQAAAFARYGEYPVSLATGVPQIEIPLYEIKCGDITVPLTISYHASGIKVQDIATTVGLGWTLNWGGCITRQICGGQDTQGYANGQLATRSDAMDFIDRYKNGIATIENMFGIKGINNFSSYMPIPQNTQSDRYIYRFNGKTGVFRYNAQTREIVTIPYAPLKIEATTEGFKIKDTDGLIYTFEAKEASGLTQTTYVTAWYITKIESVQTGRTVIFQYATSSGYSSDCSVQVATSGTAYESNDDYTTPQIRYHIPFEGQNMFWADNMMVFQTILIDEISFGNNKIKFTYTKDRKDKYKDRLNSFSISSNNTNLKNIMFDNNDYFGNNERTWRMRLNSVEIKGENNSAVGEKYRFIYNTLSVPEYTDLQHGYRVPNGDYWGYANYTYSTTDFVPRNFAPQIYTNPSQYFGADRNPDESQMKSFILQKITYPTGGETTFEFEANRVPNAYSYNSNEAIIGGLRIKKIISTANNGNTSTKTYEYQGTPSVMIKPATFVNYNQNRIYLLFHTNIYKIQNYETYQENWKICSSEPRYSITGWNQNPVFYHSVTEYFGENNNNSGRKVYTFQNTIRNLDFYPDYLIGEDLYKFWSPYSNIDQGLPVLLLKSEETYESTGNNNYVLKRKIENFHTSVDKGTVICGVNGGLRDDIINVDGIYWSKADFFPYNSSQEYIDRLAVYETIAYCYFYLLDHSIITDYTANNNVVTTINYTYDPQYRLLSPVKTTVANSNGTIEEESVTHPFDINTTPYNDMVQNNIIEPVIRKIKQINGSSYAIQNNYRKEGSKFVLDNIQTGKNNNFETRIVYHNYNSHGNPLYLTKDDAEKVVYLWAYNYQYPIAEIKNASYSDIVAKISGGQTTIDNIATSNTLSSSDLAKLDALRTTLPDASITTYTYKPLVGIISKTDPGGFTTYYDYDSFGRLKENYYYENGVKSKLETYDYHYKDQ